MELQQKHPEKLALKEFKGNNKDIGEFAERMIAKAGLACRLI